MNTEFNVKIHKLNKFIHNQLALVKLTYYIKD